MALIDLQPGESLIFEGSVKKRDWPMILGLTDRTVILAREKHFAKEAWHLERIPIPMITRVYQKADRRIAVWCLASVIFLGGLALFLGFAWNVYNELPGTKVSGWPIIFMAIGIALPFLLKDRKTLVVQSGTKLYKWKPGILDSSSKSVQLQNDFLDACRHAGIHVAKTEL